ncbi:uncharacterized protein A4U43_C08F15510 [Asparagus officinalis]|uniref:uncharacterized protein LOC109819499 n=1 Tax=Asparagus officinalis TaxID=4686 RepID=UPI00098E69D8|nr:uncharacterized protein LOC109819499 [Asparagus officinalis]ONK60206.1 uncharacterized protein A4U43_C08F15510 [Asparagus officinalis]
MARGFSGVKDDLNEIRRHLLDIACFLSPLIGAAADYTDSPPASPHKEKRNPNPNPSSALTNQQQQQQQLERRVVVAGVLNDLAEFGGGLKSGIGRISSVWRRNRSGSSGGGMREEVVMFVRDLVKCPESWMEFPVPVDDYFHMSHHQRDHIETVERLVPSLSTLRISLCPRFMTEKSFWKIYFALLHPRLNRVESDFLSTQQIVEEMRINLKKKMQDRLQLEPQHAVAESSFLNTSDKEIDTQQEAIHTNPNKDQTTGSESQKHISDSSSDDIQQQATEAKTLQYFDRWFDSPDVAREANSSTESRKQISSREYDAYSEAEDSDTILLQRKYRNSSSMDSVDHGYSLVSSDVSLPPLSRKPSYEHTSDYELVERS